MDLNYLYHRQQVERMRAAAAATEAAREVHDALADRYDDAIAERRLHAGVRDPARAGG
jgi:hypothetical protein